jgi:2-O-methyltransferase
VNLGRPTADSVVDYLTHQPWFDQPQMIVELGARDCEDSAVMAAAWPAATIHAFECNPTTLPQCRSAARFEPRIVLHEQAVTDANGAVTFMQIDTDRTRTSWPDGNPGASSLLAARPDYPVEAYVQRPIQVQGIRGDDALRTHPGTIDLLWMDLQGAELLALRGFGTRLRDVRAVFTEVNIHSPYIGAAAFADLDRHLRSAGLSPWKILALDYFQGEVLYVRRSLFASRGSAAIRSIWVRLRCSAAAAWLARAGRVVTARVGRPRHAIDTA